MSIIIRLQNLPWNANAADIRQFFQNLTIPDGGVHIVGGENGDAFIAFGSDEDARQAMLLDGGKIKEAKIKLLLSSRTEMQKVIELARQQALTLQNLMQSVAAASSFGTSSLSMLPNVLSGMPGVPNLSSLPVATAAGLIPPIAIPAAPTGVEFKEMKMAQADAKSNAIGQSVLKDNGKSRSDGKTRSRSRSLSRSASGRSHSRSRSRSRERRYRDKHRYSGNRSRDRKWRHDKSRSKERSRSRDRYKKRSRSRDRRSRDRSRDAYKSRDRRRAYDKKEKSPVNDDKNEPRKNSDPKFKTTGSETNVKNEITFLEVLPVSDKMQSPNERSSNDISSAVASLLAKSSSNDGVASEFKPDAAKTSTESPKSWMNNVPMPPIISPWMLSQTNDADGEKKSIAPDTNASTEKKSDPSAVPYGMFPPQFPFGNGFPPPPTMYPFAGYASAATPYMGADKTMPSMPSMPMPPFFNPYQNAGTVQPGATDKNAAQPYKNSNCNSDEQDPSEKFAKLEHNEAGINNEYDDYEASNFRKRNKMNNYYNGDDTRNYNSGGHRRNDDGDSYDNAYSYSSRNAHYDDTNRRTYPRRNFSDTWDNGEHMDECDERKSDFEHRKNSAFAPVYFGSVCVEMVNLPRDAVVGDVKKFFLPLPLYESSIKFQSDGKDNSTRNAFVKFLTLNHKLQALKLSGKIMRGNRITISDMDPAVWEAAEDFTITLIDQHCLKISFIPKEAQKQDVLDALPNLPDDMILMKEKNKHSLVAYLKFADNTMVKNALADKHKMLISNSRVKLEPISEENFLIARADYQTSDDMESEPETEPHRRNHHVTTKSRNNPRWNNEAREINDEYSLDKVNAVEEYEPQCKEMNSNCLLLKNLPSPVTDIDIVDFFSDINIIPSQIHIMFNTDYKQNGDSFCEFDSENEAAEALLKKNYCKMKHNTIEITMVPREEVLKAIGSQLPEKYPSPRYNPPSFAKKPYSSRPAPPYRNSNPRGFPPRGPVAPFNRPTGPENFGKPGCVVALENVPYKADVDDILDFLGQFNVQRENIIRRFNEGGQPTGDARICLRNPVEAQKVVQLLDGKRMRDRVVFVSLVD